MHVVHLSAAEVYGGGEEHVRTLLKALQDTREPGEQISLICPENAPLSERVKGFGVSVYPLKFGGKKDPFTPLSLRKMIRKIEGTIVHSHNRREDLASIVGLSNSRVTRVTTLHDRVNMLPTGERSSTFFDRVYLKVLPQFDRILAVSQATLADYQELSKDFREVNRAITNGMDLSRLESLRKEHNFRNKYGIPEESTLVMISARVRGGDFGKKGHLRLLEALRDVTASVHVVTLGEDEVSADILRQRAQQHGIPITCLGFLENTLSVLNEADLIVLPSLFEGLPRSLMEAMSLKKAVIGSNVDGIVHLLDQGKAGLIVPAEDRTGWSQAIEKLCRDPELRQTLGERASQRIQSCFSSEKMASDHWDVYRGR